MDEFIKLLDPVHVPQLILLSRHFCTQICSEKLLDGGV